MTAFDTNILFPFVVSDQPDHDDARLALCLMAQGVREFATVHVKDFAGRGFRRVFNPLTRAPA